MLRILIAFTCISLLTACEKQRNTVVFSFNTAYHTILYSIENPISSNSHYGYSDYNSDLRFYETVQFLYLKNDTGILFLDRTLANSVDCKRTDSLIFINQENTVRSSDTLSSSFEKSIFIEKNIKFLITKYNTGCIISGCIESEGYFKIELNHISDTMVINNFISSIRVSI